MDGGKFGFAFKSESGLLLGNYKFRVTTTFGVCLIQIYFNVISHDKSQETYL